MKNDCLIFLRDSELDPLDVCVDCPECYDCQDSPYFIYEHEDPCYVPDPKYWGPSHDFI